MGKNCSSNLYFNVEFYNNYNLLISHNGKAKSRCQLGMLFVNNFKQRYLNIMNLENCDPTGEHLNNNH